MMERRDIFTACHDGLIWPSIRNANVQQEDHWPLRTKVGSASSSGLHGRRLSAGEDQVPSTYTLYLSGPLARHPRIAGS
jgi:hypothetical protein